MKSERHEDLQDCAVSIFGGRKEKGIGKGIVDVKQKGFCTEIELSGRTQRINHAIKKLNSSVCGGGFLVVPKKDVRKAIKLTRNRNIGVLSAEELEDVC